MALAKLDARATENGSLLSTTALAYVWGHDADGASGKMALTIVDIRSYGVDVSGAQTAAERRSLIQQAVDETAAQGIWLSFPRADYLSNAALKFPSNATLIFCGEPTFKLSDDAPELENVWEPATRDSTTTNARFIGDFICDGNFARPTVTGEAYTAGAPRPAASCFITGGSRDCEIIGRVTCVDGVLHGFDYCSGGETALGVTNYVTAANLSPTYWPANMSSGWRVGEIVGDNCGDDGATFHYAHDLRGRVCRVLNAGNRHPDPIASNGPEFDDGCFDIQFDYVEGMNANRGIATKCHSGNPAPYGVHIGMAKVKGCAVSLTLDDPNTVKHNNHTMTIGTLIIEEPAQIQTVDPVTVYGIVASGISNWHIGKVILIGAGTEMFGGSIRAAIQVDDGCSDWSIGPVSAEDWAAGNTSQDSARLVNIASDVTSGSIGPITGRNVGYRGVYLNGATGVSVDVASMQNPTLLAGSVAVQTSNTSKNNKTRISLGSIVNFETPLQYGATALLNPTETFPGNLRVGGFFGFDGANTKTIASDAITLVAGDGSFLRIDTEAAAAADDLATINGGDALFLMICCVSNSRAVTIKNLTGNIYCGGSDIVLSNANTMLLFYRHSNVWKIINRV